MVQDTKTSQISQKQDECNMNVIIKNVPSRLPRQWLCDNSCTWPHDVRLNFAGTNEPAIPSDPEFRFETQWVRSQEFRSETKGYWFQITRKNHFIPSFIPIYFKLYTKEKWLVWGGKSHVISTKTTLLNYFSTFLWFECFIYKTSQSHFIKKHQN